jgi:peptidoglycan hydrolase-like protein with peptidoglycan-binding domain
MKIVITNPLAPNSAAEPFDVLQLKKSLNRLGYYYPPKEIGITDIPDADLFTAIKNFQKSFGLPATGTAKPDDDTITTINRELAKPQTGYYVWNTVGDDRVRDEHESLEGTIRSWGNSPDPGEDFNCRCWAVHVEIPADIEPALKNVMAKLAAFDANNYTLSAKLLRHYLGRTGNPVELKTKELEDSPIVKSAISTNQKRFEDSFTGKGHTQDKPHSFYRALLSLKDNGNIKLSDYWDVDVSWLNQNLFIDADFSGSIGSGKIRSKGDFELSRKGYIIKIAGKISHQINEIYDFNTDTAFDKWAFENERFLAARNYAKPFTVIWQKDRPFSGTINLRNNRVISADFK